MLGLGGGKGELAKTSKNYFMEIGLPWLVFIAKNNGNRI